MTTIDLSTVREAALDLALATWYDEALRLLDATTPAAGDAQGRVLLALTAADVADRADHVLGRTEAPKRFEALDAEIAARPRPWSPRRSACATRRPTRLVAGGRRSASAGSPTTCWPTGTRRRP